MSVSQDKAKYDSLQSDLKVTSEPPEEPNPERTLEEAVASERKAQTGQSLFGVIGSTVRVECDLEKNGDEVGYDIHCA